MLPKAIKIVADGAKEGIKYHIKKSMHIHQYPTFLVYQATGRCNSRCNMCNIWKSNSKDLPIEDIRKVFSSRLWKKIRWVNLTGGEPFLRTDFIDIIKILSSLPKLEGIAVPTNGMLPNIREVLEESLKSIKKSQFISVTVSIDGFKGTHNKIRGVDGYDKAMATLKQLLELKKQHRNFNVGVQPTISADNIDEIEAFYREMRKMANIGFAVVMTSEGYYGNLEASSVLERQQKEKAARFLKSLIRNEPEYAFYYTKLANQLETGKRNYLCMAGFKTVFMSPEGNLFPCAPKSYDMESCLGNAREDPYKLWFSKKAKEIKNRKRTKCDSCYMLCDFINVAKVEFYEHAFFLVLHPSILRKILKKAENSPYY